MEHGLKEVALWVNKAKKRYYKVLTGTDLFGRHWLIKAWGGIGNHLGGCSQVELQPGDIEKALDVIAKERKRRDYEPVITPG